MINDDVEVRISTYHFIILCSKISSNSAACDTFGVFSGSKAGDSVTVLLASLFEYPISIHIASVLGCSPSIGIRYVMIQIQFTVQSHRICILD